MPLIFFIGLFGIGIAVTAMIIESIMGRNPGAWLVLYVALGLIGATIGAFVGFGDAPLLLKYGFLSTPVLSFLGAALFVLFSLLLKNKFSAAEDKTNTNKILGIYLSLMFVFLPLVYFFPFPSAPQANFQFDNVREVPRDRLITNFEDCVRAGNPVMESYPRKCQMDGKTYIEVINEPTDRLNQN